MWWFIREVTRLPPLKSVPLRLLWPLTTIDLGTTATLYVGNRNTRQRGFCGWIDDFRFYTNFAGSASFVESIRQEAAPLPAITGVYPDGTKLQQATNTLVFNVYSPTAVNITNVNVVLNGVNVSSQLQYVTNGTAGTSTNLSLSYTGLPQNRANTVVISVADANGTGIAILETLTLSVPPTLFGKRRNLIMALTSTLIARIYLLRNQHELFWLGQREFGGHIQGIRSGG